MTPIQNNGCLKIPGLSRIAASVRIWGCHVKSQHHKYAIHVS